MIDILPTDTPFNASPGVGPGCLFMNEITIMKKQIVKCTRCKHIHSTADRVDIKGKDGWFHSSCPKCEGRITTEQTIVEYEIEVSKQQNAIF